MKNEKKKNNVISFPGQLSTGEREVEAILFAAAEPLEIETIEDRISKKIDVKKILKKLEDIYKNRGINLVCISNKWSFRTASNLSSLMSKQKTVDFYLKSFHWDSLFFQGLQIFFPLITLLLFDFFLLH